MSVASCADTLAGDDGTASIRLVLHAPVASLVPAHACAKSGQANRQPAWPASNNKQTPAAMSNQL
jgi:hypothetical protein